MGLLLIVALAIAGVETLVADSCDADAQGLVSIVGAGSHGAPSAPEPVHGIHLCHCSHAHAGALARYVTVDAEQSAARTPDRPTSARAPASPSLEPPLRPPLT